MPFIELKGDNQPTIYVNIDTVCYIVVESKDVRDDPKTAMVRVTFIGSEVPLTLIGGRAAAFMELIREEVLNDGE